VKTVLCFGKDFVFCFEKCVSGKVTYEKPFG
jgi:hypothetical protein